MSQIEAKAERKRRERHKATEEEQRYLDYLAMQMEVESVQKRAACLVRQRGLIEDWERETHLRNLKKVSIVDCRTLYRVMTCMARSWSHEALQQYPCTSTRAV
jgi:hypothetical protein